MKNSTHVKEGKMRILKCPNCDYRCFSFEDRKCRYCNINMKVVAE